MNGWQLAVGRGRLGLGGWIMVFEVGGWQWAGGGWVLVEGWWYWGLAGGSWQVAVGFWLKDGGIWGWQGAVGCRYGNLIMGLHLNSILEQNTFEYIRIL